MTLTDARQWRHDRLDNVWFNGEARSLLGPFKGEGAANAGGELYPFRLVRRPLSATTAQLKMHLNIDPVGHPLSIEADGALTLAGGRTEVRRNA